MSKRIAFWLAWFTWVLYLVIAIFTLLFQMKNAPSEVLSDSFNALVLLVFATVGALIASRRPQNPIGWIFCISTLLWALGVFLLEYAVYALITAPGSLPAGALMSFFGDWARAMGWLLMLTFLLLLFPNGHLLSPKWRSLAWLIAGLLAAFTFTLLLTPNQYDLRLAKVHNPLGIAGAPALFDLLTKLISLCLAATILACIVAVVFRFRRARGDERQQLKWFAYGTILNILLLIPVFILLFSNLNFGIADSSSIPLFYLSVVFIPISAAIAILKYRMYDLDVLINRTLVYTTLTATLALIYVGLVIGLQALLRGIISQDNSVAIVVSTLAIAALFQPLRRRIQRIIDRRFYRSKYDAVKTVEAFSATLRNEVDLATLSEHLLNVVQETMQPSHVSLWLREPDQRKERQNTEGRGLR